MPWLNDEVPRVVPLTPPSSSGRDGRGGGGGVEASSPGGERGRSDKKKRKSKWSMKLFAPERLEKAPPAESDGAEPAEERRASEEEEDEEEYDDEEVDLDALLAAADEGGLDEIDSDEARDILSRMRRRKEVEEGVPKEEEDEESQKGASKKKSTVMKEKTMEDFIQEMRAGDRAEYEKEAMAQRRHATKHDLRRQGAEQKRVLRLAEFSPSRYEKREDADEEGDDEDDVVDRHITDRQKQFMTMEMPAHIQEKMDEDDKGKEKQEEKRPARKRLQIGPEMDQLFLEFAHYSTFSRFAGLYTKMEDESRYGQPVWRRAGVSRQRARLYLDFDVESESWGFVAELEGDARPGTIKATCKAADPLPKDQEAPPGDDEIYFVPGPAVVASSTGMLSMRQPDFPKVVAITMRRRSRTTEESTDEKGTHVKPAIHSMKDEEYTHMNGSYEMVEGCSVEGMPVFRHQAAGRTQFTWLFSVGGRWRLKSTPVGTACEYLSWTGFWWHAYDHSSMLHSGTSLFGTWEAEPIWQTWVVFTHPDTKKGHEEAASNMTMIVQPHMVHMLPITPVDPAREDGDAEQGGGSCPCAKQGGQGGSGNCPCKKQQKQKQRGGKPSGGDCPCARQGGQGGNCPCKNQNRGGGGGGGGNCPGGQCKRQQSKCANGSCGRRQG